MPKGLEQLCPLSSPLHAFEGCCNIFEAWNCHRCGRGKRKRYPGGQNTSKQRGCLQKRSRYFVVPPLNTRMCLLGNVEDNPAPDRQQNSSFRNFLEQRSLLQNLRQVISLRWNHFYRSMSSVVSKLNMAIPTVDQIGWRIQWIWLGNLIVSFESISKKLEKALALGPSPQYRNTSAAMELIDLSAISDELNSRLVDYLIDNGDMGGMEYPLDN